ncbi:Tm-1-like ATP-binding domain-containing protein [Halalkalibaculum sp. DA3122]|uniref:Tm-1-like ATP-binding domain-containing protein n=1 Tax=Halalkalibaculum sp. DA3122 TaxID=3373607 RepID=UPI0037544500
MATIAVLGTLDTKGEEHAFLADIIHSRGHNTLLIDAGTGGEPTVVPDITREEVAAAGEVDLAPLLDRQDRGECVSAMSMAAPKLISELASERKIDGIISLGGGGGTAIATAAMRALPIGFPKVIVSTLAAGDTSGYLGTKDIVMIPSIADVSGLNRLSRLIFSRAAGAICGMVETDVKDSASRPLIVASMFGNTTKCISEARKVLEDAGYEVLVFAATGTGGRAMESLIESGMVDGVLDITTTELADELVGGILSAGPDRMNAAADRAIPAVVAPGCLDMINFGEKDSVPSKFSDRTFYIHNPQVTLMRTTPEECRELGAILAGKANRHGGKITIMVPRRALSEINGKGQPFYDPEADKALFESIRDKAEVEVQEFDEEINSPGFARACAEKLLENIRSHKKNTNTGL